MNRDRTAKLGIRPQVPVGGLTAKSRLEFLLSCANDTVLNLVQERLQLTPEKLALLITREINPLHVFTQEEEAMLRSLTAKTVRRMKTDKRLPETPGS